MVRKRMHTIFNRNSLKLKSTYGQIKERQIKNGKLKKWIKNGIQTKNAPNSTKNDIIYEKFDRIDAEYTKIQASILSKFTLCIARATD